MERLRNALPIGRREYIPAREGAKSLLKSADELRKIVEMKEL